MIARSRRALAPSSIAWAEALRVALVALHSSPLLAASLSFFFAYIATHFAVGPPSAPGRDAGGHGDVSAASRGTARRRAVVGGGSRKGRLVPPSPTGCCTLFESIRPTGPDISTAALFFFICVPTRLRAPSSLLHIEPVESQRHLQRAALFSHHFLVYLRSSLGVEG